jgi:DNA-binding transcriptional MocR family regulator
MTSTNLPDPHDPYAAPTDPWYGSYADRAHSLTVSEVRALFAVVNRPEVVSLAGGMPAVSALNLDTLQDIHASMLTRRGPQALQYGSGQGDPHFRAQIAHLMTLDGITAPVDDIVVTTGSQQGLDSVAGLFLNPGDTVLAESPTYVGALGVFRHYQANVEHVHTDANGMDPDALTETITRLHAAGRRIKFIYLVPNFNNPSGVTLTADRRARIVQIAKTHRILILEDNPYGLLYFGAKPPVSLRALDDENVIYLGSFSKIFAPGYRVGWVLAPHAIRDKLILANESTVLSPSMFSQLAISEYFDTVNWQAQLGVFRDLYRERRDATLTALTGHLPDLHTTRPDGGFFLWLDLPAGVNAKTMLPDAVAAGVAYTPGNAFYADGTGHDHLRVAFCYTTPDLLEVGISRLASVIRTHQGR